MGALGTVTDMTPGRLQVLSNVYEVDGRVSWHPPRVRGYAPMNSYLFTEGTRKLLVDTGLAAHRSAILAQLSTLVRPEDQFDIFSLRQGEFDSVGNLVPICEDFRVGSVYGMYEGEAGSEMWGSYRLADDVPSLKVGREGMVELSAERRLTAFFPALRLLNTHWVYDAATKTLLTSDSFGYVVQPDPSGPWVITAEEDTTDIGVVREHLLETRFWWLPGAHLDSLLTGYREVFQRFEVETIAPGWGCVLNGRELVERHVSMVEDVLSEANVAGTVGSRAPEEVRT